MADETTALIDDDDNDERKGRGLISDLLLLRRVVPQYIDKDYWNPQSENFHIIDWDKWDAQNPHPPKIYDPPQCRVPPKFSGITYMFDCLSHRSPWFKPCHIPALLHKLTGTSKTSSDRISNDYIFEDLLDPYTASEAVPDFLKGVFWMKDNIAPETLLTMQNWAWRPRPDNNGPMAVGTIEYGWTNDPTCFGYFWSRGAPGLFANVQIHPEGKWIALAFFRDPKQKMVLWNWMYVVQEDDEFVDPNGDKIDYLVPGDLVRLTWEGGEDDPYFCDNDKLNYMYHPHRVAMLGDDGKLVKFQPGYDNLVKAATTDYHKQPSCGGRCYCCKFTAEEKRDRTLAEMSDEQLWSPTPPPPKPYMIKRL